MPIAHLNRSVLRLSGDGLLPWLEGIITNSLTSDMTFAALLTPQGKIIADFFVTKMGEDLLIDTPKKFSADLFKRLNMYKLRAPIEIADVTDTHQVYALWDEEKMEGYPDPRHAALGHRLVTSATQAAEADYNTHRLSLGVTDSEWDFDTVKVFPADANMDLMKGVDFKKGCFVGQEVVSRMKRMTTVKKRMRGFIVDDVTENEIQAGDRILAGERVVGDILSVQRQMGMALIRLDRLSAAEQSPTVNGKDIKIMDSVDGQKH